MDKATVGGMILAWGLIFAAMATGGPIMAFLDVPSLLIVIGGCTGVTMVAFPGGNIMVAVKAGKAAVFAEDMNGAEMIKLLSDLSNRARREGLLSLEAAADSTDNMYLAKGLRMMADGHEAAIIEGVLYEELAKIEERHKLSIAIWDGLGGYGPAMGMIGTLVGLVQMLQNMEDPSSIGPAMAVALLTTLYGSMLANLVGIPMAQKMSIRSKEEIAHKELIAQGLLSILAGENPRFMVERLNSTLAPALRLDEAA